MAKNRGGRPLTYTEEMGDEICDVVSTSSVGLPTLCKQNPHWPNQNTIYEWRHKVAQFGDKYTKAKQNQMDYLVDEILTSTLDDSNDFYEDSEGKKCPHTPHLTRLRLRIDAVKWIACKLAPKVYGDKTHNESEVNLHAKSLQDLA
jgi:hypothetical protein